MTTPAPSPAPHDNAYKNIFSHPEPVEDLLRGFVDEDWVAKLDFSTLTKASSSYVTDDLRDRHDDIVWRVRMRNDEGESEWVYVYLLLEFQSSNDPYMAVRLLTYVGLLWQELIKNGDVKGGKLPAVFPVVLYNGERPWTAAREVTELIEDVPASLKAYVPHFSYFLLDEGRVKLPDLADNTVAGLVRVERSGTPQEVRDAIAYLVKLSHLAQNTELKRAFAVWFHRVVLRRFAKQGNIPEVNDLNEVNDMISTRVESWTQQWMKEGMEKGIEKGMVTGLLAGQATALRRLLDRRFGAIPAAIDGQIQTANSTQVEAWFDVAMDATHLDQIFKP